MNQIKNFIFELQEISLLIFQALFRLFKKPRYLGEIIKQIDIIGVGSLSIVMLVGLFTGAVLALQSFETLEFYGAQSQTGRLVAFSIVRELGPVLSALIVSGRIGSAISAELGSMVVSQQIDALRALGTDPYRKLVAPRIIALILMLPLLTVVADLMGIIGGGLVSRGLFGLEYSVYVHSVRAGVSINDLVGGIIKPLFFGLIIGGVSCYKGLSTKGGTVGVGLSTTNAVVSSSVAIIISDFFLSRGLQHILD